MKEVCSPCTWFLIHTIGTRTYLSSWSEMWSKCCGVVPTKLVWKCVFVVRIDKVRQGVIIRLSFTMCFSLTCTFDYNHHIFSALDFEWCQLIVARHKNISRINVATFLTLPAKRTHWRVYAPYKALRSSHAEIAWQSGMNQWGQTFWVLVCSVKLNRKMSKKIQPSFMIAIHLTAKVCL